MVCGILTLGTKTPTVSETPGVLLVYLRFVGQGLLR
jgi:hypothetical protein